jgi:hypothetical protein
MQEQGTVEDWSLVHITGIYISHCSKILFTYVLPPNTPDVPCDLFAFVSSKQTFIPTQTFILLTATGPCQSPTLDSHTLPTKLLFSSQHLLALNPPTRGHDQIPVVNTVTVHPDFPSRLKTLFPQLDETAVG